MDATKIFDQILKKAEIINANARIFGHDMGFAVPVPDDATEETLPEVDRMLSGNAWTFVRKDLGYKGRRYILFPFG